jgi:hypothetical protein
MTVLNLQNAFICAPSDVGSEVPPLDIATIARDRT